MEITQFQTDRNALSDVDVRITKTSKQYNTQEYGYNIADIPYFHEHNRDSHAYAN